MRIKRYGVKELRKARKLQSELADLHIPSPVVSWGYDLFDPEGKQVEKGTGKSNSYTRNALNLLAVNLGCAPASIIGLGDVNFVDGKIGLKNTAGSLNTTNAAGYGRYGAPSTNVSLTLGTSNALESLDSYEAPTSGLTGSNSYFLGAFDTTRRVLVITVGRTFTNKTESTISVTEAGINQPTLASSSSVLILRDTFEPITIAPGAAITWTYVFEVAYPNP